MLIGLIRPVESRNITVEGTDIPELRARLLAQAPDGWELVAAPVTMKSGGIRILQGRIQRFDGIREIEAEDMDALTAQVPEGAQLLSVRRV